MLKVSRASYYNRLIQEVLEDVERDPAYAEELRPSISKIAAMLDKQDKSNPSWEAGREAKTLAEAKQLADFVLVELGFDRPVWRVFDNPDWAYAEVNLAKNITLPIGVSSGGVVSVDGDPFTPDERKTNVTLARVINSIESRISAIRAAFPTATKEEEDAPGLDLG